MSVVFPLLLGMIQGIAEFLPISSSGQLALLQAYFGEGLRAHVSVTAFSVLLHAGTLCAVLIAYRREVCAMAGAVVTLPRRFFVEKRRRAPRLDDGEKALVSVAVGTLPLVVLKAADELLGITHQTVSKWEREKGYPDVFLLPRIAEALNCTIDELYKS